MRKVTFPWVLLLLLPHAFLLLFHALSQPESTVAPMEKREQEALYSVIQDLVGSWWNGSYLYPDPCGWTQIQVLLNKKYIAKKKGVSCDLFDGFWYVTALNIGPILENSLECAEDAKFNPQLFQLKYLKTLSFFDCFFSHRQATIPTSSWEKLAGSLESLEFRSNQGLDGEIPTTLGLLSNLKTLVLVENSLAGELPLELGNLVHLKKLILSGNKFSGQIPGPLFSNLTELLILDFSRNFLSGSLPFSLCNLSSLLKLDLNSNQFHGSLPLELGNLRHLTLLDLRNNSLYGTLPKSLSGLESLQDLLLSHNPWGGSLLMDFEWDNLRNLTILDLSHMGLTGGIPEAVASLKRLRYLALNNNHLSGSVSVEFAALPNLTALYLNGNNFTGKLEFPERFYQRMGKRFASWNNPSLCYTAVTTTTGDGPHGVAQCNQDQDAYVQESSSSVRVDDGKPEQNSGLLASFWLPASSISGFWLGIVAQEVVIIFLLIMFL